MSFLKPNTMRGKSLKSLIFIALILGGAVIMSLFMPANPENFGAYSLVPAIVLIGYIFITKQVILGLILATLVGVIMVARPESYAFITDAENVTGSWLANAFNNFSTIMTETMQDGDIVWLIIVCGLMGSIIALIEKSGGAFAFGKLAAKHAKTQRTALIWSWILGIIIFIDDYLNSLTIGACMTKVTDKHKTPREMLAYVVDSTAAPICVLIPISTWSVFVGGLLETNGACEEGQGLVTFIKTIPYNFYGWIAALIVPLVILGVIPKIGRMKKAYERVENGGPLAPPNSEKIDVHAGEEVKIPENVHLYNMLVPIIVLVAATCFMDMDMQNGVLITLGFMFIFYLVQGLMDIETFIDTCIKGFTTMIMPLLLMVLAFMFANISRQILFTKFVIDFAVSSVSITFLPLAIFVALAITEFITGTNWGMYIIALPIVIPLAQQMGANVIICISAVLSAGVFGSHICFYSDATVITSAATGCDNMEHSLTQLPYGLMAAGLTAVGYLILGFMM